MLYLGYFELSKPIVETENQHEWQDFFLRKQISANAPDYIKKAVCVIERANMREEELEELRKQLNNN